MKWLLVAALIAVAFIFVNGLILIMQQHALPVLIVNEWVGWCILCIGAMLYLISKVTQAFYGRECR